ncbi:hypothetical protein ETD83_34600 [Actinomadura soli]|uniref:Uncharacterized protein n=1 Tax=Actinomadura soli TaxID=2508997 RepID=A0A5C4J1P1_9ACTN|nr:hypothetical protein [Actinomadura soli]TMQ90645.1 hypothetical protein ETD83_34600 [Actinomadura soli]
MAAVAVSVAPDTVGWVSSLFGSGSEKYIVGGSSLALQCDGFLQWLDFSMSPWYVRLSTMPYLVLIPAFLVWLVTKRRAVGWVAAGVIGPVMVCEPLLLGYDAARWGGACADLWLFPYAGRQIVSWAIGLVPVVLILTATYRPGRRAVRAVSATVVVSLMFGVAADAQPPRTVMTSPDDYKAVRYVDGENTETLASVVEHLSQHQRRLAYVCSLRGYPGLLASGSKRPTEDDPLSDGVLLDQGERACRGDKQMSPHDLGRRGARWPTTKEMAYLCPETALPQQREADRRNAESVAEYRRYRVKALAYCKRTVPHGPRPVRQFTDLISGGESSSYSVGSGDDSTSFDKALHDGLVAAAGQTVTVSTGSEGDVCLTVRAYREAPPLVTKGWERVAEVGFDSADGRAEVGSLWAPVEAPPVTAAGPGPYRLRVHVRGRNEPEAFSPEMPKEHHLIVVFPGRSKKQELFKNAER